MSSTLITAVLSFDQFSNIAAQEAVSQTVSLA
jgi:hypothetical protein